MSKLSGQQSIVSESKEFLKPAVPDLSKKSGKSSSNAATNLSGSYSDINQVFSKSSSGILSREDSISSKNSFKSLFPNIMPSFDSSSSSSSSSSGFTISQSFVPRTEKTQALFDIVINTLKNLKKKYSEYIHNGSGASGDGSESTEKGDMRTKVENRIVLIEHLKSQYEALMKEKEVEIAGIKSTIVATIANKAEKEELDMMDCESYWSVCREMCLVESKLERCAGKLQFQIMELDSVSRVSALDQYELSIRLNDISKFKTRIKVEKKGHQVWDNTTFVLNPTVDDTMDVKFSELKTLNKSLILLEKKVPYINNLILAEPSIYSFWLSPCGTIKLKVIVQWNASIDDPDLGLSLDHIDNRYHDMTVKDGVVVRKRITTSNSRFAPNRLSINFGNLFRSDGLDKTSLRGSMENIAEHVDDDDSNQVNIRRGSIDRDQERIKAKYLDDIIMDIATAAPPSNPVILNTQCIVTTPSINVSDDIIVETSVKSNFSEPSIGTVPESTAPEDHIVIIKNDSCEDYKTKHAHEDSDIRPEELNPNEDGQICDVISENPRDDMAVTVIAGDGPLRLITEDCHEDRNRGSTGTGDIDDAVIGGEDNTYIMDAGNSIARGCLVEDKDERVLEVDRCSGCIIEDKKEKIMPEDNIASGCIVEDKDGNNMSMVEDRNDNSEGLMESKTVCGYLVEDSTGCIREYKDDHIVEGCIVNEIGECHVRTSEVDVERDERGDHVVDSTFALSDVPESPCGSAGLRGDTEVTLPDCSPSEEHRGLMDDSVVTSTVSLGATDSHVQPQALNILTTDGPVSLPIPADVHDPST